MLLSRIINKTISESYSEFYKHSKFIEQKHFLKKTILEQFERSIEKYNKKIGFLEKQIYKSNYSKIYLSENLFQLLITEENIISTKNDENILFFNFKNSQIPCEKGIPKYIDNRTPYMIVIDIKEVFLAKFSYSKENNKYSLINGSFTF